MFLSADEIRAAVAVSNMISRTDIANDAENASWLSERMSFIEGSGFDITISDVYSRYVTGMVPYVGREERSLPEFKSVRDCFVDSDIYHLYPAYYLLQSAETISLPETIGGIVLPRSSFFNAECIICGTRIAPGFSGQLRVGLYVCGHMGVKLQHGARFATVMFYEMSGGSTDAYKGIWSGSKLTTQGTERGY